MLNLKQGIDILSESGGIKNIEEARALLKDKLDNENFEKLAKIKTEDALVKVANAIAFCKPDAVYVTTGSKEDMQNTQGIF